MTIVDSLIESLFKVDITKLPELDLGITIPGIGTVELDPEPIADKFGPKEAKKEVDRTLNDIYKDTVPLDQFYNFVRNKGTEVYEVPQSYLVRTFGYAHNGTTPIGWRTGNAIYIARNDGNRYLREDEKMAVAAHEYGAGYNHEKSDIEAQKYAIQLLSPEGEFPDPAAHGKTIEFAPRVGLYNFSLN